MFGLVVPVLVLGSGFALDITNLYAQRQFLQTIADGAALAGAAELRLGNSNSATVLQVARNYVNMAGQGAAIAFSGTISTDKTTISVALNETIQTIIMKSVNNGAVNAAVSATAKVVGGAPVCVIGLDTSASFTVGLDNQAQLVATNCAVYSNSTQPNGLFAKNSASLTAAFICSARGKAGAGPGSFSPVPQTDCPVMQDPLINRPPPPTGGCTNNNTVVDGVGTTLYPGTYCGGLTIQNSANVILSPGVYVMLNGPFTVTGGASVQGSNVGFYLSGSGAVLNLDTASTVTLTAPATGSMAGLLIYEDRNSPQGQTHNILSDNARTLLGTIYLPQGMLYVGANQPVADQSAYTIVVARQFSLSAGPTMVLNTNYTATNIPVPNGVGPSSAHAVLTQ
jgi:Flp pilus assembly protein TadG